MHKTASDKRNLDIAGIAAEWQGYKYRKPFEFQVRAKTTSLTIANITEITCSKENQKLHNKNKNSENKHCQYLLSASAIFHASPSGS